MDKLTASRRRQRGFTIMEVVLAMTVFLMMTLMFAAAFPLTVRAAQSSSNYAQATQVAQHKIDQLRAAGYGSLNGAALAGLGIIDSATAVTNPAGLPAGSTSYSFTTVDNLVGTAASPLSGYFAPGSTGTVTISPDSNSGSGTVLDVSVLISWTGGSGASGNYSVSAVITQ